MRYFVLVMFLFNIYPYLATRPKAIFFPAGHNSIRETSDAIKKLNQAPFPPPPNRSPSLRP